MMRHVPYTFNKNLIEISIDVSCTRILLAVHIHVLHNIEHTIASIIMCIDVLLYYANLVPWYIIIYKTRQYKGWLLPSTIT